MKNERQKVSVKQDDPTTPGFGHPELCSAYRALFGPEEGSYKYLVPEVFA